MRGRHRDGTFSRIGKLRYGTATDQYQQVDEGDEERDGDVEMDMEMDVVDEGFFLPHPLRLFLSVNYSTSYKCEASTMQLQQPSAIAITMLSGS